jgi:ABC-type sugar transport system substrate-binding protein
MSGVRCLSRRAALTGAASAWAVASGAPRAAVVRAQKFGVSIPDSQSRFFGRLLVGMQGAAKTLGIELRIEEYSNDPGHEAVVTQSLLKEGLDGYLLVPLQHDENAEKFVASAKAPSAAVVRRIPRAAVPVLPDLAAAGIIQANIAISLAQPKTTLLYVTGSSDIIEQDAVRAFVDRAKENVFQVAVVTTKSFSPEEALNLTVQALDSHPDVTVVAAAADVWALGAVAAAERLKRPIQAIGLGDSAEAREAIGQKRLAATVDLRPDKLGYAAVQALATVVNRGICDNGQNPPCPEQTVAPQAVVAGKEQ